MMPGSGTALGIDVGSVSVNLALLAADAEVLATSYHRCEGRPVEVLAAALEDLATAHPAARPTAAPIN